MPWLALPFADRKRKAALSKKFKVEGIPTLVVVDAKTGEVVGKDARSGVMRSGAAGFPWPDPTLRSVLGSQKLVRCAGAADGAGDVKSVTRMDPRACGCTYGLSYSCLNDSPLSRQPPSLCRRLTYARALLSRVCCALVRPSLDTLGRVRCLERLSLSLGPPSGPSASSTARPTASASATALQTLFAPHGRPSAKLVVSCDEDALRVPALEGGTSGDEASESIDRVSMWSV